jgi:hypothetical protein
MFVTCSVKAVDNLKVMYLVSLKFKFILRVQAGYWLPDKTNLLWIGMVIILSVSLLLAPGISRFISYCQQKKEDKSSSEVVYICNPGESLMYQLGLTLLFFIFIYLTDFFCPFSKAESYVPRIPI